MTMRIKRRCEFEKYFRGRVNRIWQLIDGRKRKKLKKKITHNFLTLEAEVMLILLAGVRK